MLARGGWLFTFALSPSGLRSLKQTIRESLFQTVLHFLSDHCKPILTLSAPNFRRHLLSAFFILTNCRLERHLYVKLKDWMPNCVDSDETAH